MKKYKTLNINGATVDLWQLQNYLEKEASKHIVKSKCDAITYPVPHLKENYEFIKKVYNILDEHLKLGINVHPAGEWILDNFYIIEEAVRNIEKELSLKKYTKFVGLQNDEYKGFARIYVLASEIVAYTDSKIESINLEKCLEAYQTKKTLDMDEIWSIGIFLQIAIIEKIRQICEKIYSSEIQKYNAENIIERLVENKSKSERKFIGKKKESIKIKQYMRYPFIEYMSYSLKKHGKKAYSYLNILEEEVEKTGMTVSDVIRKEHFDIAVSKVSIGNSITSIKNIQRINFLEIFEKINGVEEILKQDPACIYEKMDCKTKEYYRTKIKELSKKLKVSEIYMSKKILELANKNKGKKSHIGYYLVDEGINNLYSTLGYKYKKISSKNKAKIYISEIVFFTILISGLLAIYMQYLTNTLWISIVSFFLLLVPISELVVQISQYILSKIVKPKLIPKLDCYNGINKENASFVVIPTIIKSKEKVRELMKKLEVFYLANKSENLYFALLGDCSQSNKKQEDFDQEVIAEGIKCVNELNQKYKTNEINKFYFLYRERIKNEKENCYLGWERKRGMLNQFNDFLVGKIEDPFLVNTISGKNCNTSNSKNTNNLLQIKYVITLDSDTDLTLNSAFELIGAMAHILNKPVIDKQKNIVVEGYAIMQPRVGINLDISYKNWFTKIFAGSGGIDSYTNAISDIYQDNFLEGIFTGKGIYDLKVFSDVLSGRIPENTVLSHDLLEGCYLRCALVSDILLMDGYPSKYNSFINRLSRWIRGDWQISKWLKSNLNLISKYKIFDNLRRSVLEIFTMINIIFYVVLNEVYGIKTSKLIFFMFVIIVFPFLLEILNSIVFKRGGEKTQEAYTPKIAGVKGAIYRGIITLGCLPYKAIISQIAIAKTLHRMTVTHKNLLEWTTSEEAEKMSKTDLASYYKTMFSSFILGLLAIIVSIQIKIFLLAIVGILWIVTPFVMWQISREQLKKFAIDYLNKNDKKYIIDVAKRTWDFFYTYLNEKNNYLIPDNYQENRKNKIVLRTSSTNIGLSLLTVISAYNLGFIMKEEANFLLEKIIDTIESLPKWNGHLYNWYDIRTKQPLNPKYVSTVDSGNFVGYLYVTKAFLESQNMSEKLICTVSNIIENTKFDVLYSNKHRLFSIGFNSEENKLTDSYYDLLATEARQASFVAIAKRDIPVKHWNNLSRTLTLLRKT